MLQRCFRFVFILLVVAFASVAAVRAQSDADVSGRSKAEQEDFPKGIKDTLVKNRIEREKKDFQELLDRGEEAAKLSDEIDKSFAQNKRLTLDDERKLERIEKLSKKIREELGASGGDDDDDAKVSTTADAVDKLKAVSQKLSDELKKSSRYTLSAVAVQSSNAVLRIVRFIRQDKN